ncbi:DNA-directed RNA polymerase [Enterospora canceri]|uniref:DNA-directed RNA polymerase subunit beta n=1 Tax=Enterospora canceri TaxID=1081671 RepID=A0A1Y1SAE1_9MICR|nr:DNA-directed RNA polymerase [Enterospora canceri]
MKNDLVELFFREKSLVRQHIESYDYFIEKEIHEIVQANNTVVSDIDHCFYLRYLGIRIEFPTFVENMVEQSVYPQECRTRDITYSANILVDIEYTKNKQKIIKKNVHLGKMPIMLRSSRCHLESYAGTKVGGNRLKDHKAQECVYDNGGYFIIRGVEKVIQIQEQLSRNRIILETGKGGIYSSVTSASIKHKSKTNVIYKNEVFYVQSNIFTEDVPALVVIKAMGVEKCREIYEYLGIECAELIEYSYDEIYFRRIFSKSAALLELSKFVKLKADEDPEKGTERLLRDKILPNVECSVNLRNKAIYLCLMIRKCVLAKKGHLQTDDKDYLGNKRFELAGQMLSILFEDTFKKFNFEFKKSIDKILSKRIRTSEFDALTFFNLQTGSISSTLNRAISSGNWNLKRFRMERSGVTHVLTRYSYITALGMMTKINSHFEKTRKVSGPRSLHTSSWGMFCPADTPEGESCGLVKNLALLAEISTDSDSGATERVLAELGVTEVADSSPSAFYAPSNFLVYVNGSLFGLCQNPVKLAQKFREIRRSGLLDKFVSIFFNKKEQALYVSTDNGRICRPLVIVAKENAFWADRQIRENALKNRTFTDLVTGGFIEYLDVNEENDSLVALSKGALGPAHTHLEVADCAILSLVAATVPFPHHNQSPRNTYQCAMGKQAVGHVATNAKKRSDLLMLKMNYTQRPLASSLVLSLNRYNLIPAGLNAMVAVMNYTGYDIEDAVVLNKQAIDRGFARVEVYRTLKIELNRCENGRLEEIHSEGGVEQVVGPGTLVREGDALLSKVRPDRTVRTVRHKGRAAYVDRVILTRGEDDPFVKIVFRETRVPEIGDKFSSRHGQKGVVGLVVQQCDMPFNEQGISPDIVMNPHGFPSRMTVGKILEQISGKAACCTGNYADATAFEDNSAPGAETQVEKTCSDLVAHGFSYSGKDVFTSGVTGEQFESFVFFGPIFYQRLKHMVADKIHCRARGPRAVLTRQPTEGRQKDGGLRLGEMERDCLIGYGASALLSERLMHCSDEFDAHVCAKCGVICYKVRCSLCGMKPVVVKMPYACKLLFQELMAMNILPKIGLVTGK